MIIERIKVERFRCLREFEHELGPGLVVIHGPNESGKSTLLEAIVAALYSKPGPKTNKITSMASWGEERLPRIVLEIMMDDGPAKIEKDFEEKKVEIIAGDRTITSAKEAQNWIEAQLGCPTHKFFLATACVREENIEVPRIGKTEASSPEIISRLQAMLTGAPGGSPAQVMKRIKKRYDKIRKKPGTRDPQGGPVAIYKRQLEEARDKLKDLRRDADDLAQAQADYEKTSKRLETLDNELTDLKTGIDNHKKYLQADQKVERLSEQLERLMKAEKLLEELDDKKKRLKGFEGYAGLGPPYERLISIKDEVEAARKKSDELDREKYRHEFKTPYAAALAIVLALVSVVAGGLVSALVRSIWPVLAGMAVAVPLAGVAFMIRQGARRKEREKRAGLDSRIAEAGESTARLQAEIEEIIIKFKKASLEECLAAYREYTSLATGFETTEERVIDLAGTSDLEKITGEIKELSVDHRSEKEYIKVLMPYRIDDKVRLSTMEREAERRGDEQSRLHEKMVMAEAAMKVIAERFDPGELAELIEDEAQIKSRLDYYERQLRVHEKAMEVLKEATEAVMEKAGDVIEREIGPIMSSVTKGRYEKARADNDLSLYLYSSELDDWVEEDDLSLATREQLHFAARIALVRLITDNKKPPLILDDPFSHYDSERLGKVMDVIKKISSDHQVIIFSPVDRYNSFADRVVEL